MAKKGLFSSALRPTLSSSSGLFSRRGDPLVSQKEQLRDFGRTPDTENPERDWWFLYQGEGQHTRARFAGTRPTHREEEGQPIVADTSRRIANIKMKMNSKIRELSPKVPRPSRLVVQSPEDEKREEMNARLAAIHRGKPVYGSTGMLFKKGDPNKGKKKGRKK